MDCSNAADDIVKLAHVVADLVDGVRPVESVTLNYFAPYP